MSSQVISDRFRNQPLHEAVAEFFEYPKLFKADNNGSRSIYKIGVADSYTISPKVLVAITKRDSVPIGAYVPLSRIPWISFQAATLAPDDPNWEAMPKIRLSVAEKSPLRTRIYVVPFSEESEGKDDEVKYQSDAFSCDIYTMGASMIFQTFAKALEDFHCMVLPAIS